MVASRCKRDKGRLYVYSHCAGISKRSCLQVMWQQQPADSAQQVAILAGTALQWSPRPRRNLVVGFGTLYFLQSTLFRHCPNVAPLPAA